jgi:LemA protein
MGVWAIVTAAAVVVVLAVVGYVVHRLRSLQQVVDDTWEQVRLAMRRRHELAEELAAVVQARTGNDADLLERVGDARAVADLPGGSPVTQSVAERGLDAALTQVLDTVETSESLAADPAVIAVRERLDDANGRIAARRKDYDDGAKALHRAVSTVPARWIAKPLGIRADV